jgi:hypothetical protein
VLSSSSKLLLLEILQHVATSVSSICTISEQETKIYELFDFKAQKEKKTIQLREKAISTSIEN